jgi:ADP-ribosylarginine hydrolase
MSTIEDRKTASIFLSSYLDTLGFNNGNWEFNMGVSEITTFNAAEVIYNRIITQFFSKGGFSNINISKWDSSDDTLLLMATAEACINGSTEKDFVKSFLKYKNMLEEEKRASGNHTLKMFKILKKKKKLSAIPYLSSGGGCGASMRTGPIGVYFWKPKDQKKLIETAIMSSRLTHNYPLGFLGGMTNALFVSFALQNIYPIKWCDKLIELNENGTIDNIMEKTNIYDKYMENKDDFWDKWYQYQENRLYKLGPSRRYPVELAKEKEYSPQIYGKNKTDFSKWGANGSDSVMIAYDSLLLCRGSWDSLVYFSALHFGDNDTTGTIAGGFYGAIYGFQNTDFNKIKQLEFYQEIKKITDKIN